MRLFFVTYIKSMFFCLQTSVFLLENFLITLVLTSKFIAVPFLGIFKTFVSDLLLNLLDTSKKSSLYIHLIFL